MSDEKKENKENELLKQMKELDLKIDVEKDRIKQSIVLQEELENINASYNRCLEILANSARGKQATQKYNDLYTQNRIIHVNNMDELDRMSSEARKNIDSFSLQRDDISEKYSESRKETSN